MRGIAVAQLPTSLLAQVDSCLGGKTGVDLPHGKNLAGTFHQPAFVLAATDMLDTLPDRQFRAGLAEAIKMAVLHDEQQFDRIAGLAPRTAAALDAAQRAQLVVMSLGLKGAVVAQDATETGGPAGGRQLLNLGHTTAHALERVLGYSEALLHGEAVAIGMVVAARIAEGRELAPAGTAERIAGVLAACGLPDRLPAGVSAAAVLEAMGTDKKRRGGKSVWILPRGIALALAVSDVSDEEVLAALECPPGP
jgi:3-dehydroquinate synthase